MALPVLNTATYELTIPSNKKKIEIRPFLVKEEKVLLTVIETGKTEDIQRATKNLIETCTNGKLDMKELTPYDVDYIFLQIRARSVGEHVAVGLKCTECEETNAHSIDITEIKPTEHDENIGFKFDLTDDVGVIMRHPRVKDIERMETVEKTGDTDTADSIISIIAASIESIYDKDSQYFAEDHTPEELIEFVNNLRKPQLDIMNSFFEGMPKVAHDVTFNCSKCGHENHMHLEGLSDFF